MHRARHANLRAGEQAGISPDRIDLHSRDLRCRNNHETVAGHDPLTVRSEGSTRCPDVMRARQPEGHPALWTLGEAQHALAGNAVT